MSWFGFGRFFDWMHGFGWIGGIGTLMFAALVGLIVFLVVRSSRGGQAPHTSRAEDILKERLAKGEINEEEYENLLKKIK